MNVGKYLSTATKELQNAEILTARLDILVLLEDVLGKDRATLLAHPELALSQAQLTTLNNFVTRRAQHEPLAYIRGRVMFYGREFAVNKYVLVPRPETEMIIDMLKKMSLPSLPRIADIGTGTGCIGITAALELPGAKAFLYDIDTDALNTARKNAATHHLAIHAEKQNLLDGCTEQFDIVLANLPYVPNAYPINQAASFEPKLALFSGNDGLDHYRIFWQQLQKMSYQPAHVLIESLPDQQKALVTMARAAGYERAENDDYVQRFVLLDATEGESKR